jgi:hypothetical protein
VKTLTVRVIDAGDESTAIGGTVVLAEGEGETAEVRTVTLHANDIEERR